MKRLFPDHGSDGDYDQFVWRTAAGEITTPGLMTTTHLYWSARMVFNHTVPESLRLTPFRVWVDLFSWPADTRDEAHTAFMTELGHRPATDLTPDQRAEVEYMRRNRAAFDSGLLEPPLPRAFNDEARLGSLLGDADDLADQDWENLNHEH